MKSRKKLRLDRLLMNRGLAESRERAQALILAGHVQAAGITVPKAGSMVAPDVEVTLKQADHPYVSRGALKLRAGLDAFDLSVADLVAMDIGASTGGFTDLLLQRGARRVYAIDVGYGQLAWKLRNDPRVVVIERENVRYLDPEKVPEPCDLAVIDVSFISLTLVLPKVVELLRCPGGKPIVVLVKPQFEVGKDQVGKGGVVRDPELRTGAVQKIVDWATNNGFGVGDNVESPIQGPAGNIEYVLLLRSPA